jgi:hypothetical protein
MTTYERWIQKKVLITVRTYPTPAKKGIEVSCTAGITDDGQWIRLFPIPYRFLDHDKRFTKYQYIEASVAKSLSDTRPESYKVDVSSIKILPDAISSDNQWEARKNRIFPLKSKSLCSLQAERNLRKQPTLGFFKPKVITCFKIRPTNSKWSEGEIARLKQYPLFGNAPLTQLEKLPFDFFYEFYCDDPGCHGHILSCIDWEIGAAFLQWRKKYGNVWEQKFRETFETKMIIEYETYFFVGTMRTHPDAWIIIGLFYPPKQKLQAALF